MDDPNQSLSKGLGPDQGSGKPGKAQKKKSKKFQSNSKGDSAAKNEEVLLKLPGGFKYKLPGKRQRVLVGSIVVGLNLLLVIAVVVYFYNPSFQQFIYNVGRN